MRKQSKVFESVICSEAVDECSELLRGFLGECRIDDKDILRYTLTVEEILLNYLTDNEEETYLKLSMGEKVAGYYIQLEIGGAANNVFIDQDEENGVYCGSILRNLSLSPDYRYLGKTNIYSFRIKKKSLNSIVKLMIAIAAALIIGSVGFLFSDALRQSMLDTVVLPLHNAFLDILGCIAGPMIFLSVAWGIYGIGDAATLKNVGRKLIFNYIGVVFIAVVAAFFMCLPVFTLNYSAQSGGGSELSAIVSMLLGIIPKDIFSPFVSGNTLQIILLAAVIGIAMLFLGRKTDYVAQVIEQINYIVQFLIEAIGKLVPYFIFIVVVKSMWSGMMSAVISVYKLFAVFIPVLLIVFIGMTLYTALKNKLSPLYLARKGLPTLLVAFVTASSAAAFGSNMKLCRDEYGINDTILSFGLPLGMVTFKPTTAVSFLVLAMFLAEMYGVGVSASWFIVMIICVWILAIATPPIPGGALTAYTVLLAQLGIPAEALAIALACDAVFDFIVTGFDQYMLPMALLNKANYFNMANPNVSAKS